MAVKLKAGQYVTFVWHLGKWRAWVDEGSTYIGELADVPQTPSLFARFIARQAALYGLSVQVIPRVRPYAVDLVGEAEAA